MEFLDGFWQQHYILAMSFLCIIAFIAGFIDSIAGGGGLFLMPSLLLVGLPPQIALAQNKAVSSIGTLTSVANFIHKGLIIWKAVIVGVISSLFGAYLGVKTILLIPPEQALKIILVLLPIAMIIFLLPKKSIYLDYQHSFKTAYIILPIVTFCIGFYDGFFGPGAGTIFIISLNYFLHMNLLQASANTKILNWASNFSAFITFLAAKKIMFLFVLPLILCNTIGNYIGSRLAIKKGSEFIKKIILISISILFISLIVKFIYV